MSGMPPTPGSGYPGPSPAPPTGSGLTQPPGAAPGGVAQGAPPQVAQGALPQPPQPGFGMQPAAMPGAPPPSPVPGMVINPAFMAWRQQAMAWQAEKSRRQQQFLSACQVIRRDAATGYKVDIEADSTIAADEQAEKAARTEFLTSIVPLLQIAIPELSQNPAIAPLVKNLVMFGVRAFPAARSLEDSFEQAFATLGQAPPQPPPGARGAGAQKSPAEIQANLQIAQGEQQVDMAKIQADNQKDNVQMQIQQQKDAADMFRASVTLQQQQQKQQADNAFRAAQLSQQQQQMADRSALEQARMSHLISRDTAGLV